MTAVVSRGFWLLVLSAVGVLGFALFRWQFSYALAQENRSPVIESPTGDITIQEGETLVIPFTVQEPDNDIVDYAVSPLPTGATLFTDSKIAEKKLIWWPDLTQAGSYELQFRAVDEQGQAAEKLVRVTVLDRTEKPAIKVSLEQGYRVFVPQAAPVHLTVEKGKALRARLDLSDPEGELLTPTLTDLPLASLSQPTDWRGAWALTIPGSTPMGVHGGMITVSDSQGNQTSVPLTVEVRQTYRPREYLYAVSTLIDWKQHRPTSKVVQGTVALDTVFKSGYAIKGGRQLVAGVTLRYVLETQAGMKILSPPITGEPFPFSWDTTTVADGTHVLGVEFLDGPNLNQLRQRLLQVVVDNVAGAVTGVQPLPVTDYVYDDEVSPHHADWITYPGSRPHAKVHPYPYKRVAPVNTLADPMAVVANNKAWYVENVTEPITPDHESRPGYYLTKEGHPITSESLDIGGSNGNQAGRNFIYRQDKIDGGRGDNGVSPYATYVPDPEGPGWVGVDMAGRVFRLGSKGEVVTIAGSRTRRDVIPFDYQDITIPRADLYPQLEVIGTFENNRLFESPIDLAFDPRDSKILYIADTYNHRIAKINFHGATPLITTYAGQPGVKGYRDGPAEEALFHEPYSIALAVDGTMYVADEENNVIRKISADGGTVSTLAGADTRLSVPTDKNALWRQRFQWTTDAPLAEATINYPQVIRLDSQGNLIIGEHWTSMLRRINFATGRVEGIGELPNDPGTWIWLDVDVKGNVGPKDDILVAMAASLSRRDYNFTGTNGGPHNDQVWRFSADGSRRHHVTDGGYPTVLTGGGRANQVLEPVGHYPWPVAIDDEEARFITGGFGNNQPVSVRLALPADPVGYDHQTYERGRQIWTMGTVAGFPYGSRPAFSAIHGKRGFSRLGSVPNFDDLVEMADGDLAAYIQKGMAGTVPRPEISGDDLRALVYFIRRTALQGEIEEITLPPVSSDKRPPEIRNIKVAKTEGDTVRNVSWQTDEPTLGIIEYGPTDYYGVWTTIESGYAKDHTITISDIPPGKADSFHLQIRAKDVAGNQTVSVDRLLSGTFAPPLPLLPPPPTQTPVPSPVPAVSFQAPVSGQTVARGTPLPLDLRVQAASSTFCLRLSLDGQELTQEQIQSFSGDPLSLCPLKATITPAPAESPVPGTPAPTPTLTPTPDVPTVEPTLTPSTPEAEASPSPYSPYSP